MEHGRADVRIRLRLLLTLAIVVAGIGLPRGALAQQAPPGELVQVAGGIYYFRSQGYISLFIVTNAGVIATDPSSLFSPARAEAYKAAIASVTDQPVRYVIYSH